MPQLIFKGFHRDHVRCLSETLTAKLASALSAPEDYFTFECQDSSYFGNGRETEPFPMVEVQMFRRPPAVRRHMAELIAQGAAELGYRQCDVYFIFLTEEDYHEFCFDAR